MSSKSVKVKVKTQPSVIMESEVARKIRQHARTSMKAEVCGILLGSAEQDRTVIDACIAGVNAAQGGAHVTFTQDTWEHIYKIKDQEFPDSKIVGWYHSHPGFGVFLSEHDLFIQENFFSDPQQVAWVYDPHTDEEGCFGWVGDKTEKLSSLRFGYTQNVEVSASAAANEYEEESDDVASMVRVPSERPNSEPAWMKWVSRTLMACSLLGFGFLAGLVLWFLSPWAQAELQRIEDAVRQHDQQLLQQCGPELQACQARLFRSSPLMPADSGNATQNPQQPAQAQQKVQTEQKGQAPQKQQPQPKAQPGKKPQPEQKIEPGQSPQPQPKPPASAEKGSDGKH
jgi:proteasome lid subunit RPN8/RPN11